MGDRAPVNNLPVKLTTFVGRSDEVAELHDLVCRTRLLTLTGAGGCGKSRLAAHVARQALPSFPDGAWFVELAPISEPELVPAAVAHILGVRPSPDQSELDAVIAFLAPRRALVVLDNCEHLLSEAARTAEAVARACPRVAVLTTSREPLRAEGETQWRVPSLSLPALDEDPDASDAVRLFLERAAQAEPRFTLTPANTDAVVSICCQLDGMPLAIELAAAGLGAFSVDDIAARLTHRFRLLTSGVRTALPRHQTLRASVDWSHDLLSNGEQMVLRRLGVFAGSFTVGGAEWVCAGAGVDLDEVLGLLVALVEKSLVQPVELLPVARYRLLETVRHYALERLTGAGETGAALDRHRDFYLDLAEQIAPELLTPRQAASLEVLDPEATNLNAALEHAAATEPDKAVRLCVALVFWLRLRSLFALGEAAFTRALEASSPDATHDPRVLWGRAYLLVFAGELSAAMDVAQGALAAAEERADPSTAARTLWLLGTVTMWPDPIGARLVLERARRLAIESGDEFALMHATQAIGMSHVVQEDHRGAAPYHAEAGALAERLGQQDALAWHWIAVALRAWASEDHAVSQDAAERALVVARGVGDVVTETMAAGVMGFGDAETGRARRALEVLPSVREQALIKGGAFQVPALDLAMAMAMAAEGRLDEARAWLEALIAHGANGWTLVLGRAHVLLAEVWRWMGDADRARVAAEDAGAIADRCGQRTIAAEAKVVLGRLQAARGEWADAQRLYHEALPVALEVGLPRLARVLDALAETGMALGRAAEAARLLGAAERLRQQAGGVPSPQERAAIASVRSQLRDALGADEFEEAWAGGRVMSAEDVVAYVRRARGARGRPPIGWGSLTPTELEVARHVAEGMTNAEVGERMFIAPTTVRTHLTNIFAKLELKNRASLTREVTRRRGSRQP